ncbi:hypothetical protein Q9189_007836 [Teloschistes chrysophthalmus]
MQLLWVLTLATAVSANPFWFREEAPDSEPSPATSASSSKPTASASGTASPAEPTALNGTAPTENSKNGTAAATSTSTAAATDSAALPEEPNTTATCHIERGDRPVEDVMPFCEPKEGQYVHVGETYAVTWDPTLFTPNATNQIELKHENNTNGTMIWSQSGVVNEAGSVNLLMHEDYLQSPNRTNLTLFIHSVASGPDAQPLTKSGPVFTLITNATLVSQEKAKGKSSGAKELGEKAGVPVGLGVFLIACAAGLFWFLRRRRNAKAGYLANRSRPTTRRMTGDDTAGGGFRDEPTRGMELQDRGGGVGAGRKDSWEAGWETGSSQGGGNAFRDEVERQRRR